MLHKNESEVDPKLLLVQKDVAEMRVLIGAVHVYLKYDEDLPPEVVNLIEERLDEAADRLDALTSIFPF